MAGTIIDALVVTLGLDPSQFIAGQKAAGDSMVRLRTKSGEEAKKIEAQGKKAAEFFREIRQAASELLALFTAGLGTAGALRFLDTITGHDVALGRLADRTGQSAQMLSAWGQASESLGGSAQATENTIASLVNRFALIGVTGDTSIVPWLAKIKGGIKLTGNGALDAQAALLGLADTVKGLSPATATAYLSGLGLDPGTITLIEQGRGAILKLLGTFKQLAPSSADIAAAEQRQKVWTQLDDTWIKVGRTLTTEITPALVILGNDLITLAKWADQHKALLDGVFTGAAVLAIGVMGAGIAVLGAGLGTVSIAIAAIAVSLGAIVAAVKYLSTSPEFFKWLQKLGPASPNELPGPPPQMGTGGNFVPGSFVTSAPGGTLPGTTPAAFITGAPPYTGGGITGALLQKIAYVESGDNPNAVSPAGAEGLFQFMPGTAAQYGINPFDPTQAIAGAKKYLTDLMNEFGGDVSKALAAYNWGPGNLAADISRWGPAWREHLPAETSAYLAKILGSAPAGSALAPPGVGAGARTTNSTLYRPVNVTGPITVHTQATDAKGIATDLQAALRRTLAASDANLGFA